jgi:hypothetical protein
MKLFAVNVKQGADQKVDLYAMFDVELTRPDGDPAVVLRTVSLLDDRKMVWLDLARMPFDLPRSEILRPDIINDEQRVQSPTSNKLGSLEQASLHLEAVYEGEAS